MIKTISSNKGFTLIELMVVVGIIGILASLALPQYRSYVVRAQLVESLTLAREVQDGVQDYYKHHGRFPKNNKQAGVPEPQYLIGNYVKQIQVADGAIHITLGNKINMQLNDKIISLRPLVVTGSPGSPISWNCGFSEPPQGMQTVGENKTDIDIIFLGATCRGG